MKVSTPVFMTAYEEELYNRVQELEAKLANGVLVTYESYADACEKADKDMHRMGFCESFFERVCKHLGLSKPE